MAIAFPDFTPSSQPVVDPTEVYINTIFNHVEARGVSGTATGELWGPRGVAINPSNNHIFVAEGRLSPKFARLSIFSETGEYLENYSHKDMESLWGIAIDQNNVYVTDRMVHAVFHLKLETELRMVARVGSKGSDIGQFDEPRQLCIFTNGDIYIADRDNDRIQILDSCLHPMRVVTHPSLHKPYDVKITTDEIYVLSPEDSPCVHVFTLSGLKIRSLITRGDGMPVDLPLFFCVDAKSLIFSDYYGHQIEFFSNDGALIQTLGKYGHKVGKFSYPHGLAFTSRLNLVIVSSNKKYGLQIYSSQ